METAIIDKGINQIKRLDSPMGQEKYALRGRPHLLQLQLRKIPVERRESELKMVQKGISAQK